MDEKLLFRMDEWDCRTLTLEAGMQNAGLASGIAKEMGKIDNGDLASVHFGPFMNIAGSILASDDNIPDEFHVENGFSM